MDEIARSNKFNHLYTANARDLLAFALRRSPSRSAAADVVAETMLVAWRRISEVPDGDESRLWLFGVARNVINNAHRSSRRHKRLLAKISSTFESVVIDEPRDVDSRVRLVRNALLQLRPIEAEVVSLNSWEQLSPAQIAVLLKMPPETVRTHLHRARLKLKDIIEHEEGGE